MSDTPRLMCRVCGYPRFSIQHVPEVPARAPRLFGLIAARPAQSEHIRATCLACQCEQPFGFTAEDVATCSIAAAMIRDEFGPTASEPEASQLRSLAARLAALLPPEGTP